MTWKSYKDLDVFQRAYSAALDIHKISQSFPPEERYSLTSQIRRSSKSICANIVEGHGKSSFAPKEFIRYLNIALGSAEETKLWLHFCKDLGFLTNEDFQALENEYSEIIKMLYGLIKSLQK